MYDLIIIGAGPAGMTAGIYAARREMKTLIIGREVGGQMIWASEIENYPGFETITSFELITRIKQQTLKSGAELKEDEVKEIKVLPEGGFAVYTNRENFTAKAVLVAMGLSPRRLAVPGELEFSGRGVSYCANCDGPFYRNKTVAVIGGGNSALDAAEVLSKMTKKVYLLHRNDNLRGFEVLQEQIKARPNIEIILSADIKGIIGAEKLEKIAYTDKTSEEDKEVAVDGVFIEIGRLASTDLVAELADRNEKNQIIVSAKGETKTPGLYAAGDVTDCEFKQITVAMGQATTAALSAYQYLQTQAGKMFVPQNY